MRAFRSMVTASFVFVAAMFTNVSSAWADFITFTGTGSGGLAASVTFEVSGSTLIVTLTNTSSMDVMVPSDVLTGVWFSLPGSLTPVSAEVTSGSWVNNEPDAGSAAFPNVNGEWAYKSGMNMSFGSNSGISSSGMDDIFGVGDLFSNNNLYGPGSPDGLQYGITSAGDDPTTGNGGINGTPLTQNSVTFTMSGWNSSWTLSQISNVFFQYGTSIDQPRLQAVPEPGVLALLGLGLVGLVFGARRMSWA